MWEKIVLVIEKKVWKFGSKGRKFAIFLRSLKYFFKLITGVSNPIKYIDTIKMPIGTNNWDKET